jgi:hypothetical protein
VLRSPGSDVLRTSRQLLLAIVVLGLVGIGVELLLLAHYADVLQWMPLALIAAALVVIGAHVRTESARSLRVLRVVMALFIVSGAVGIGLHYRGNLEFQLEIDPTQSHWDLFRKVVRSQSPPALAPGFMAQLGLLGLLYTYRHPALERRAGSLEPGSEA